MIKKRLIIIQLYSAARDYLTTFDDVGDQSSEARSWRKKCLDELRRAVKSFNEAEARRVLAAKAR